MSVTSRPRVRIPNSPPERASYTFRYGLLFSVYVRDSNKGGFACKIATFRGTVAKPVVKEQSDAKAALPPKNPVKAIDLHNQYWQ